MGGEEGGDGSMIANLVLIFFTLSLLPSLPPSPPFPPSSLHVLGSQSLQSLRPGQLLLHSLARPLSASQVGRERGREGGRGGERDAIYLHASFSCICSLTHSSILTLPLSPSIPPSLPPSSLPPSLPPSFFSSEHAAILLGPADARAAFQHPQVQARRDVHTR